MDHMQNQVFGSYAAAVEHKFGESVRVWRRD